MDQSLPLATVYSQGLSTLEHPLARPWPLNLRKRMYICRSHRFYVQFILLRSLLTDRAPLVY